MHRFSLLELFKSTKSRLFGGLQGLIYFMCGGKEDMDGGMEDDLVPETA